MTNIIYRCNKCHYAPTISKEMKGADGRPALIIRCKCRVNLYRCDIESAKRAWNEQNKPLQQGRPRSEG